MTKLRNVRRQQNMRYAARLAEHKYLIPKGVRKGALRDLLLYNPNFARMLGPRNQLFRYIRKADRHTN